MSGLKNTFKDMSAQVRSLASDLSSLRGGSQGTQTSSSSSGAPSIPRFSSYQDRQGFRSMLNQNAAITAAAGITGSIFGAAGAVGFALPTTQEAVDVQSIASRMNFYGGAYRSGIDAGYNGMLNASNMGTALSPMDAPMAINSATAAGLLPGLSNFGAGAGYSGIMGGAALASNLTPGLGLAGGVGVMANLQNPQKINMAKMFGLQFRDPTSSNATDLPSIIDQLFNILSKSAPVTKENIAISAMPGNALDSILNQYFGMDPQLRNVVIAGLIQKAGGGGLDKASLIGSGALTNGVLSTGNRATSEQNLIQTFAGSTNNYMIGSNEVLNNIYSGLVNNKNNGLLQEIQKFTVATDTISGARNGAGQLAIDSLFNVGDTAGSVAGQLISNPFGSMAAGLLGTVGGAYGMLQLGKAGGLNNTVPSAAGLPGYTGQAGVTPTSTGQTFTGAITVNVSGGVDQYNMASAITQALSQAV